MVMPLTWLENCGKNEACDLTDGFGAIPECIFYFFHGFGTQVNVSCLDFVQYLCKYDIG